ncbi:PREDICTED: uncharacterized protein LOC101300751 [Fragaria vesca subsp. vesca]|uniref:uncharacterized protein LOC101300751 n=1 Tax=Fragaria vesca subsp. vesca TaxID=101020 RepID=UPI0002C340B4|nr:PREDICTED: uncharacterized protein LOC101300751 [Fragaria vesca subsp. vesca]
MHLAAVGMLETYEIWHRHGEKVGAPPPPIVQDEPEPDDFVHNMLNDIFPIFEQAEDDDMSMGDDTSEMGDAMENQGANVHRLQADTYEGLLAEANREFFPGCDQHSALTAMIKLMHCKVDNHWSNKSFTTLMETLYAFCPKPNNIPKSFDEAKKMLKKLGLGYEKIDVCQNDCVLFYKGNATKVKCPECGADRYKPSPSSEDGKKGKNIPHKVLRYFPLKPRLERLFMSRHIATEMRWHKRKRADQNGVMRHPADSIAWKEFDKMYPDFAMDPRNVRLGLATDGFTPFGNLNPPYSMWPVMVFPYNLPPWMCMKKPYTFLTLLIPGPTAPGKDLDVFLRPLIDELKELWETGVRTYDKSTDSVFDMKAAVLWTVNDFPAYGNLSGWSTKGYLAWPVCNADACSYKLRRKIGYLATRRWLRKNHPWRKQKELFNNEEEKRSAPKHLSDEDILRQVNTLRPSKPGKHKDNPDLKRKRMESELNWTKKSIFFELEY